MVVDVHQQVPCAWPGDRLAFPNWLLVIPNPPVPLTEGVWDWFLEFEGWKVDMAYSLWVLSSMCTSTEDTGFRSKLLLTRLFVRSAFDAPLPFVRMPLSATALLSSFEGMELKLWELPSSRSTLIEQQYFKLWLYFTSYWQMINTNNRMRDQSAVSLIFPIISKPFNTNWELDSFYKLFQYGTGE